MKRRLFKLVLFLVLGAIINVAVAWGCGIFAVQVPGGAGRFTTWTVWETVHPTRRDLEWLNRSGWQPRPEDEDFTWKTASREISGFGLTRKGFFDDQTFKPGRSGRMNCSPLFVIRDRTGWPFRCLQAEKWLVNDSSGRQYQTRYAVATVPVSYQWSAWRITDTRPLAVLPIWPGFAINTIFYAVILWLLTLGPFTARRIIRRRRGLCINCGYDLRGAEHEACPECGVETTSKVVE